jgi:putative Mg2+ transporter-C (MgtC) family protein
MDHASVPVDFLDLLARLGLAALVGAIVGVDRELNRKPAGMWTHALVSLGACVFMMIGMLTAVDPMQDLDAPGRVIQGIVAGVGFIGAGAIFRRNDRALSYGLTTAATIWIVAALGTAAGAGLWRTALAVTVTAVAILLLGDPVDRFLQRRSAQQEIPRTESEGRRDEGEGV